MKRKRTTPRSESPSSSPSATLPDVTSVVASSGFLPPRELFRFARSSKAVAASLADFDVWKQLCIARLGEDAVEKLQKFGFAKSVGEGGGTWERVFRALVTQGQIEGELGKRKVHENAELNRIPKSYFCGRHKNLSVPALRNQREDYCIILQMVKEDDVAGAALFSSIFPGEELIEQQEGAFFEDGKALTIEIPADGVVPKEKVFLEQIHDTGGYSVQQSAVLVFVHLLRKTDGKVCCILESFGDDIWQINSNGLPLADEKFCGLPVSLDKVGRDFIGNFYPDIIREDDEEPRIWHRFLSYKVGIHLYFRAEIHCHYERSQSLDNSASSNLTDLNLLRFRLTPELYFDVEDYEFYDHEELFADFLPMKYTSHCSSGAISTVHFLEQLMGWM